VQLLPGFLRELRATLSDADLAALEAAPTLRTLRPVIPKIRPALVAAGKLAPELERVFRGLSPVLTAARSGVPALTRVLNAAKPLVDILYPTGRQLVPVLQLVARYKRDIVGGAANVAAATNARFPNGSNYLRVLIPITNEAIVGAVQQYGSNRSNPYPESGWLDNLGKGVKAFDCKNVNNPNQVSPLLGGPPPCIQQSPQVFQGRTSQYISPAIDGP